MNGNSTQDGTTMLTITVKHSVSMKSRAIMHVRKLDGT
jgi:hypothetical protein